MKALLISFSGLIVLLICVSVGYFTLTKENRIIIPDCNYYRDGWSVYYNKYENKYTMMKQEKYSQDWLRIDERNVCSYTIKGSWRDIALFEDSCTAKGVLKECLRIADSIYLRKSSEWIKK